MAECSQMPASPKNALRGHATFGRLKRGVVDGRGYVEAIGGVVAEAQDVRSSVENPGSSKPARTNSSSATLTRSTAEARIGAASCIAATAISRARAGSCTRPRYSRIQAR